MTDTPDLRHPLPPGQAPAPPREEVPLWPPTQGWAPDPNGAPRYGPPLVPPGPATQAAPRAPLIAFGLALASFFILPNLALISWYWRFFDLLDPINPGFSGQSFKGPTVTAVVCVFAALVVAMTAVTVFSRSPVGKPRRDFAFAAMLIGIVAFLATAGIAAVQVSIH